MTAPPDVADRTADSRIARIRVAAQRFGGSLAAMVMPNIGAFIAWGLLTALFAPNGWLPDPTLAALVKPAITYLLPVLIGASGGRLVHGHRGAVVGAVATIGLAVGTAVPVFFGAMIVGPLAAYLLRAFDRTLGSRVRPGFRMLVDNYSSGVLGGAMAVAGMVVVGPAVQAVTVWLGNGVQLLLDHHVLPLASAVIEPAKVLFLNNAVNHGVLGPIGAAQAAAHGKAIEFLMETNPGPGLGVLLACLVFGPRSMRPTVPGAIVIHFFGGIHEIYFPYVLARPRLLLAAIAGGAVGILTLVITDAGTIATPSPGSIIAVLAVTPKGGYLGVLAGVTVAAATSFAVGSALLGFGRAERNTDDTDLRECRRADD
ncbi:PTS mannitol transporter subunit IICB [Kutzneria buriramensis]|uniref:PTS system mannitol-specific IIC component n=1 Tax=Kutzneria buriramensis TaxID=1045776 RepID=A0A3E0HKH9_9PSEU|nr:PTS mannitol transporter subunit IICB [Kutzneria buriramensis]REH46840.1 PTS system mannitol-specific IIC component [Kutzneria buriramensis]